MLTAIKNDLQRATPESQGIASAAILQFVEAVDSQIHEFHSFMLLRHGKVVAEGWWSPYGREIPHMLFSLSKSFTSTAVGLAVAEGYFSLDDRVTSFFPDDLPAEVNEQLAAMQVRHLLSMSTGQIDDTMPIMGRSVDGNWTKAFFTVPVVHQPGTHFLYNTGATYMLSAILQKKTGMKLVDYLQPRLFEPLGIEGAVWDESPQGFNMGGFGLNIKTEDIARFGQLYLQKGLWQGRRILSESWVAEATSFQVSNGEGAESDWTQGYGYQFWRCRHGGYRGDGAFGQYCLVMPDQDAVLAITAGVADMQVPLNLIWELLLPAMSDQTLPDDETAQDALTHKLASLHFPPIEGAASLPTTAAVSGRTYRADANDLKIEAISLTFTESGCIVKIRTASGEQQIDCGYDFWQAGRTTLFNDPWEPVPEPILTSGAWTANDTFMMVVRLYRTPFFQTIVCRFADNSLTVETTVNVGFEPPKPHLLTGHSA